MHQQRFQRVAGAGPRDLAVEQQVQSKIGIGGGIHVQMTHALVMLDHRHPRMLGDEADQAFAAARDRQIDDVVELQQFDHRLAAQVVDQGQRSGRYAGIDQRTLQRRGDRSVAADRFGTAAQDHAVAGLQAQRRGVGGDVRPRLVDHRDHAERHAHAFDLDAVGPRFAAGDLADRIGQIGDLAQRVGDARKPLRIKHQPVEHRAADAFCFSRTQIFGIGGEDRRGIGLQRIGHGPQQCVLGVGGQRGDRLRGIAARQRLRADGQRLHGMFRHRRPHSDWMRAARDRRGGRWCRRSCSRGCFRCPAICGARYGGYRRRNTG